jgi:2-iminobutanoate/2-iminopropanoate deaminase
MSTDRTVAESADAPDAVGPYSQAVGAAGLLFCSGQIPLDPESGEICGETAAEQTTRCLRNLAAVGGAAGTTLDRALRLTVYTTDLGAFSAINEAYAEFFESQPPARTAVQVAALPKGAMVEIDAIVAAPE